ncbi:MAG: LpqB family beta-propeller domain-containing protein [Acidobacteriota bacterium]
MRLIRPLSLSLCFVFVAVSTHAGLGAQENKAAAEGKKDKKKKKKKDLPLEPTRKIEFETDEGTWLSLDVSPDGKTVLFEMAGDLYTVPLSGGGATRITQGMAFDSQPAFSPDGKHIAFISDRDGSENLWVATADGSDPKKLTKGKKNTFLSPTWAPDSRYVVVSKGGRSTDLWMYHIDGGSGINLTGADQPARGGEGGPPGATPTRRLRYGATLSPDGRYLYFARKNAASVYNQMSFGWQVFRRDMKTGDVDRITQAQGGAIRPRISPDGKKLVYASRYETRTGLRIRDLDSGQDHWLRYPVQRDDMESRGTRDVFPGYAFTPDGSEVVVTYGGKINRVEVASGLEHPVPFKAQVSLDIGPLTKFQRPVEEGPVRSRLIQDPVQSPDGKQLAFSAMAHLYVMDLPDGQARRITSSDADEFKPTWSPNGRELAFVSWDYSNGGHLWKVAADGSEAPRQLTDIPAFYTDPVFSPDGSRIVLRRGNAWMRSQTPSEFGGLRISLDLVWIPSEGGQIHLIVPARGLGSPHFTHDENRIYFYSREGLVSMRYDGTDRRTHLKVTGKPFRPGRGSRPAPAQDVRVSPDGQWALAEVANQVYVMAVPSIGKAPTNKVFSPSLPTKRLTDIGADSFGWADDGKTVTWAVGSTFFRRPFESISFEKKEKKPKSESEEETEEAENNGETEEGEQADEEEKEKRKEPEEADKNVESFEVDLEFPRHKVEGTVVLSGATVITMKGDEVIENADIVVKDNRILAVGKRGRVDIPVGARRFDAKGKYIVPGFVDTHAHYEMRTEGVLELHNWSFDANLAYGVTTGLDVQTSTNDYLTYQDLVEAGRMIGPRAYSTGPGVFANNDFQSGEGARFVLEKYKKYYRNNNLKSYMVGNRKQRQWVVKAANDLKLTVTTEGGLDLKLDMTHAMDGFGGNEHALPIVPLYKDVVELFAQSGTSYTPTLLVLYGGPWAENYYYENTEVHDDVKLNRFVPHNEIDRLTRRRRWFRKDEYSFPKTAAQATKIQRAGGKVGVGGHGQLQGLGYHWEMWSLAAGGMTPREVLTAATIDGAFIIGLVQDLGSIEKGKLADLVVLDQNPLENIHNTNSIRWVMKDGELYEGDTLKQLYPVVRELRPFWWWEDETKTPTDDAG